MGSSYPSFALKGPATPSFPENNTSQKKLTQLVVTTLILLLIQILFDLHDVSGLKDAECCSLVYVDINKTALGNDDVLPFPVSNYRSFPPLFATNLTAGKWKRSQREGCKESLLILYWFVFFYKDLVNALLLNHYEVKSIDVKYNLINYCSDLMAFFETMTSRQKFKKLCTKTPIKL